MALDSRAERARHAFHRQVVVCRADAARRKYMLIAPSKLAHRVVYLVENVGDDDDALERHAECAQLLDEEASVLVGHFAREDLVADQNDPGGRDVHSAYNTSASYGSKGPRESA